MNSLLWSFSTEFKLLTRQGNRVMQPLLLFCLISILFPLSLPVNSNDLLFTIAPGVIWITALLAMMMNLNHLFDEDYKDGTLEQILLSQQSTTSFITAKIIVYWLSNGLLISLISPAVGYSLGLSFEQILVLLLSLSLGTLALSFLGALVSSLVIASKQSGLIISILALPLYMPIVIFGSTLTPYSSSSSINISAAYYLLALTVLTTLLCPIAIRYSLKYGLQ